MSPSATFSPSDIAIAAAIEARARPPRSRAEIIERPGLLNRLESALDRQVVAIQAPAGFGKTTLLSQALARFRVQSIDWAWLTIDPSDGTRQGFLRSVARALIFAGQTDGRTWPLSLSGLDDVDEAESCSILMQVLAQRGNRVVLVLDDCHMADTPLFVTALNRFMRALPDNVRIVISGRWRPSISLSELRARGLVSEFVPADLQFTPQDVQALFGNQFVYRDASRPLGRAEGWPAMLQLARQIGDLGAVGADKTPMHPVLREYIVDQIVRPMSPQLRELLAKCTIFTQFCEDLAESVSDVRLTHPLRSELSNLAPLVAPVNGRREWLAFHPMMREVLTAELEQHHRAAVTQLHRQAAIWFAAHNEIEPAVHHARDAENFVLAADTIERAGGVRLFIRAGNAVLTDLLNNLPQAVVHANHGLQLAQAVVVAKQGRIQDARHLVEEVRQALRRNPGHSTGSANPSADIAHIDDLISIYEDREVDAAAIATRVQTVERTAISDTWMRGWIYNHLAIQLYRYGDLRQAHQAAHSALACYREQRTTYVQTFMLIHLGLTGIALGRIAMSLEPSREAEGLVNACHPRDDGLRAIAQVPLAEALYAKNDLVGPRKRLDFAIPVMAAGEGWVDIFARALETRIRIALVEEGLGAAIAFLDRGYEIAEARNLWRLRWTMDTMRHEVMCRTNLLVEADEIGVALGRDVAAGTTPEGYALTWRERLLGNITLARGALCRNNPTGAIAWVDSAIVLGESLGAYQWLIPALILRAIAAHRNGDADKALDAVQRAIAIAAPQGVVRPFVDEGRAITSLIRQILRRFGVGALSAANTEFVASILNPVDGDRRSAQGRSEMLLSEREHEILGLLNHGLANKEIARSVGVSEATVKFHLKNLYGKLGVNSRVMALAVARQQHLLH